MTEDHNKAEKNGCKRKENYDEKLKIRGSLFDLSKVAVTPSPEKDVKREPGQISFKDALKKAAARNPRKIQSK